MRVVCAALATASLVLAPCALAEYSFSFSAHAQSDHGGAASSWSGIALNGIASSAIGSSGADPSGAASSPGLPSVGAVLLLGGAPASAGPANKRLGLVPTSPGANAGVPDSFNCLDPAFASRAGTACAVGAIAGTGITVASPGDLDSDTSRPSPANGRASGSAGPAATPVDVALSDGSMVLPTDGALFPSHSGGPRGDGAPSTIPGSTVAVLSDPDGVLANGDLGNPPLGTAPTEATDPLGTAALTPSLDLIDPPAIVSAALDVPRVVASVNVAAPRPAAVPEPGTLALLGVALVGLAILPRRSARPRVGAWRRGLKRQR